MVCMNAGVPLVPGKYCSKICGVLRTVMKHLKFFSSLEASEMHMNS